MSRFRCKGLALHKGHPAGHIHSIREDEYQRFGPRGSGVVLRIYEGVKASDAVVVLAELKRVDLTTLKGSGAKGAVIKADVEAEYAKTRVSQEDRIEARANHIRAQHARRTMNDPPPEVESEPASKLVQPSGVFASQPNQEGYHDREQHDSGDSG